MWQNVAFILIGLAYTGLNRLGSSGFLYVWGYTATYPDSRWCHWGRGITPYRHSH